MLSAAELEKQLVVSKTLSSGSVSPSPSTLSTLDPEAVAAQTKAAELHELNHDRAAEAVKRIFKLEHGSSKDRYKHNVQRCVNTFGRHNTDQALPARSGGPVEAKFRAGPDTGSSEVQIAILTAKIRTLANFLDGRGRKDVANKRSLQLLVHKRQKLLKYLRARERGGPRWQNCIDTLGLTEATWKGEIAL
jgi:ribosomal protein S15